MSEPLTFYLAHDNEEDVVLLEGDPPVVVDSATVTRVMVGLNDNEIIIDSATLPAAFSWPVQVDYEGTQVNGLRLKLQQASLTPGIYRYCRLTIYDGNHPKGLVWTETLQVRVTQ